MQIADQAASDTSLESQVKPMFLARTEGDFYRFHRKYYFRDFGYRGPA